MLEVYVAFGSTILILSMADGKNCMVSKYPTYLKLVSNFAPLLFCSS